MNRSARDRLAVLHRHRFDEAVFARSVTSATLPSRRVDAVRLGIAAQVSRVEAGIEMEGVARCGRSAIPPSWDRRA